MKGRVSVESVSATEYPVHHDAAPTAPRSRSHPLCVELRRDAVESHAGFPQHLHAFDYGVFALEVPVGFPTFAAALFRPFAHPCAPKLCDDPALGYCATAPIS